jgi:hypothetical protein
VTTVLDSPPERMAASTNRRWWALGALGLAVVAVGVDGTVLSVALPTLSKVLHASESDLQWFSSGYFLVLAAAMLPAGLLGGRYGRNGPGTAGRSRRRLGRRYPYPRLPPADERVDEAAGAGAGPATAGQAA